MPTTHSQPGTTPLLSYTLWTRALVVGIVAALVLVAMAVLVHEGGEGMTRGQLGLMLTVLSCALLGMAASLGERWCFYEDRVERVRFGRWRTTLPFGELETLHISLPQRLNAMEQTVSHLRELADGNPPPIFTLCLLGRTSEGYMRSLCISSKSLNYHRDALWIYRHLLTHCPVQKQRTGAVSPLPALLRLAGWTLLFFTLSCLWDALLAAMLSSSSSPL